VFENNPPLTKETPWFRWPERLRSTYDLHDIPQSVEWEGWRRSDGRPAGPIDEGSVIHPDSRLGRFVQPMPPQLSDEDPDELLPPADQYESSEAD
jgi:hypothetical protein